MIRILTLAAVAALVVATPAEAKRAIRIFSPAEKLVRADVVAVGKVTAIEKDTVEATPNPGDPNKLSYKVAVVKIETPLVGADNVTHVKVGFIPAPPDRKEPPAVPGRPIRPVRGGFQPVNLTKDMEALFYLTKHHSGEFYIINPMLAPIEAKAEGYKDQLTAAKKGAEVLADPMKALKSDKADERLFAAVVMVNKYRAYPDGVESIADKVPADESKLVLKALAEGNWKPDPNKPEAVNGYQAFSLLGLNAKDSWKFPMVKPGEDFIDKTKEAFTAWLAGPGKDYQINKWVPKK